ELGCQEGLGSLFFQQNCNLERYLGIDMDEEAIIWSKENLNEKLEFMKDNFLISKAQYGTFDAVVSLDVIEHIEDEKRYFEVIVDNLKEEGIAIIGTPNEKLSPYASEGSKIAHINLYTQERLYETAIKYFENVFIFNMNDEVVNMGFDPMSCYIFALCCGKK
ncbi:MAG: class I SAM-dependent methyltransferase, partial [Acetivibrio sp.]